jgi:hypothetical protein
MSGDLEARLKKLEDIEELKQLQAKYGYLIDTFQPEEVVKLMVDDVRTEYGPFGDYQGKEEVLAFLNGIMPVAPLMCHEMIMPLITINGDTAKANWYLFGPFTWLQPQGKVAAFIQGKYTNDYVRVGGEWKIKHIRFVPVMNSPYEDGWVKTPFVEG